MFFNQTFVLYHDNGNVEITDDLLKTVKKYGGSEKFHSLMKFNLGSFEERKRKYYHPNGYFDYEFTNHMGFFLCNEKGLLISPDLFYGEYEVIWNKYWEQRNHTRTMHFKHNRSWVHKHNNTRYKHPQTMNARRASCAVLKEEGEPEFRGKRKVRSIPTLWDDKRTRHGTGWKYSTKRKHQYK